MVEVRHPEEESLDSKAWCWSAVPSQGKAPCQRSLHTGAVLDSALYVFGGYDGVQRTHDFYKYCFKSHRWAQIATQDSPPSPRDRHISVVHDHSIFIHGGYDGYNRVNDFYEYNIDSNTWSEVISSGNGVPPTARHSHAAVVYDGCMYVFAGYDGLYRNDFHRFSFEANTWAQVVDSLGTCEHWPKPRYRTTATVLGDKMLVFGGHEGSRKLNDFYCWDFKVCTWTEVDCMGSPPSPRDSHVAVAYHNSLFIFGGSTGNAKSDFYEFKTVENRWFPVTPTGGTPPSSRFCHIGVVQNKCFYIFGGYDGSQRLNDFKMFRFEADTSEIPNSTLLQDLEALINQDSFSDVTFVVEDQKVFGHKFLMSRSSYFSALLAGGMAESSSKEVVLSGVSLAGFLLVQKYLYTDKAEVTLENAMELFELADRFCIERLKRICELTILNSISVENAPNILLAADQLSARTLRDTTMRFILEKFDAASKTQAFIEMGRANVELLLEILSKR